MPASLTLSAGTLFGFLLVLVRVAGALVFVPLPGFKGMPEAPRVVLAMGITVALFSRWPLIDSAQATPARLAGWILAEAALGIAVGVSLSIVLEAFAFAAQVLGLQAGYAYASTIDPNTEADSGVLLVFAQLMAGMLFFAAGLDRELIRLFALSLERVPVGRYSLTLSSAEAVVRLGASLFSVGLRLALPVVALLIMVDLALALLGRVNAQLQLLSLAFPAKMLTGLGLLAITAAMFPRILLELAGHAWTTVGRILGS
jgi:flagellar biosynthetic protein FliR